MIAVIYTIIKQTKYLMKNSLLLAALVALPLSARERTTAELCAAAQEALTHNTAFRAPGVNAQPIKVLERKSAVSIVGYADGGYAIIGNDDQIPAVLAYSDGVYADAADNYNFTNYMEAYNGYLDYCAAEGVAPRFIGKAATFNPEGVKTIMTCRWNQGGPYNYMCPFVYKVNNDGQLADARCITGCVATAMAQIIYTLHQKFGTEIRPRGAKRYAYMNANEVKVRETLSFGGMEFDWDNMCDTYSSSNTYVQNMAVARLMYACGVAAEMVYSPGASGAYASTAANGINAHFEGITSGYSGYGISAYEQAIYDEFDAGRPVLITGADKDNNGHAFVGDGYDKTGKIHLNFGWSGAGDSYFTLVDMGGYIGYQTVNIITPTDDVELRFSNSSPLDELEGLYASASFDNAAETIEEGKWYILYNVGHDTSLYSSGLGKKIMNFGYVPVGDPITTAAPMMVRFIPKSGSTNSYYIQTGTGDYFGSLVNSGNGGTVVGQTKPYTYGHIKEKETKKYFWFKQGTMVMDCNNPGGGMAGWGTTTPTDTLGNNSWMLLPVTLSSEPGVPEVISEEFDEDHNYIVVNYDGTKNYYLAVKSNVTIGKSLTTQVAFKNQGSGWNILNAADKTQVVGVKVSDFKLGNGSSANEVPMVFYMEPTGEPVETDDEFLNATSKFYRIRCEAGYLATAKLALGGTVYCNLGPHAQYGNWLITDKTAYDAIIADGIAGVMLEGQTEAPVYDLQGRRVVAPSKGNLYIQNGRKVIK